ncbi:hypothetical protein [Klenkia brasiliensis]|uniref:Uncharacterized protein n=1 Tax=Klenkia brasiliensis TaxID=333142 RepID=A0A1G7Z5P7_9ACTN|nr:hypothetical protein [Klenkia brasiliensis]SDH04014.1 hypothetical protein SAMN05660324_4153 [Klenkia brasiliensis]
MELAHGDTPGLGVSRLPNCMINRSRTAGRAIIPLMGWAIGAVVVLLLGMPLAAVWWSRRTFWSRLRPGKERDPFGDTMRRHELGAAAMARVEDAVLWGRRLEDPAERAAVVDLVQAGLPRPFLEGRSTWVVVAVVIWGTAVAAMVVFAVVDGRWGDVNWFTLVWLAPAVWMAGNTRRAIRRNSDPPATDAP